MNMRYIISKKGFRLLCLLGIIGLSSCTNESEVQILGNDLIMELTAQVNRVYAYIAPKLIGGKNALPPVGGDGIEKMKDAVVLQNQEILHLGADYCIRGDVVK